MGYQWTPGFRNNKHQPWSSREGVCYVQINQSWSIRKKKLTLPFYCVSLSIERLLGLNSLSLLCSCTEQKVSGSVLCVQVQIPNYEGKGARHCKNKPKIYLIGRWTMLTLGLLPFNKTWNVECFPQNSLCFFSLCIAICIPVCHHIKKLCAVDDKNSLVLCELFLRLQSDSTGWVVAS